MENIITLITEKTGITNAQAKTAIETVVTFLKEKMPAAMGEQVDFFIDDKEDSATDLAGGLKDNLNGVFGM